MRVLYHLWQSPQCRMVRLVLAEKGLEFEARVEKIWDRRDEFLALSPGGDVPVLAEPDGTTLTDALVICEYLEEVHPRVNLLGDEPLQRAETRRLTTWFHERFDREVTANLVGEKITKRMLRSGTPHSDAIRAGHANIHYHLDYIGFLMERRNWLAGERFSLADIAAAAQLSCVDYLGDVPWEAHPEAKDWYARVKSRPSFRPLLADHIPGTTAPAHYADLDF
ncbi:MAG TPA: glutathione S-transferase family protein [Alphaproteobacteria bacterium]|nr:glutathione S-transferase family protein [Alphaproteobacteria bacterium]